MEKFNGACSFNNDICCINHYRIYYIILRHGALDLTGLNTSVKERVKDFKELNSGSKMDRATGWGEATLGQFIEKLTH